MFFLSERLKADEVAYTRDTANAYLNSKSDVYLVKKIAGFISYEEYRKYLEEYSLTKIDDFSTYQDWKNINQSKIEKLLVLAKYKGDAAVGSVIEAISGASTNRIEFSEEYIVFFTQIKKNLPVIFCIRILIVMPCLSLR